MTTNTNGKAAGAINTNGLHTDTNGTYFPTVEAQRKALVTQISELALAGHAVHQLDGGGFIVCKYGMTRHCGDAVELQSFARKLGVSK